MTEPLALWHGWTEVATTKNRFEEEPAMAKQRMGTVSPGSRDLHNSMSENGSSIDSTDISTLAYQLWQGRGCPEGSPEIDWLEAEKQLRAHLDEAVAPQNSQPILVRRSGA
jgi:hypothetical protein